MICVQEGVRLGSIGNNDNAIIQSLVGELGELIDADYTASQMENSRDSADETMGKFLKNKTQFL